MEGNGDVAANAIAAPGAAAPDVRADTANAAEPTATARLASESIDAAEDGPNKKARTESTTTAPGQHHEEPPSRVLHVRGLPDMCQQNDLATSLQSFGAIRCVRLFFLPFFLA